MRNIDGFKYLSASEAARRVGCASRTIARYCEAGSVKLKAVIEENQSRELKLNVWRHPINGYYFLLETDADKLASLVNGKPTSSREVDRKDSFDHAESPFKAVSKSHFNLKRDSEQAVMSYNNPSVPKR